MAQTSHKDMGTIVALASGIAILGTLIAVVESATLKIPLIIGQIAFAVAIGYDLLKTNHKGT